MAYRLYCWFFGEFNGEFELDQSDNGLPELSKENTYLQGNECGKGIEASMGNSKFLLNRVYLRLTLLTSCWLINTVKL